MFSLKMLIFASFLLGVFFRSASLSYKASELKTFSGCDLEIVTSIFSNPKPLNRVKLFGLIITNRQSSLSYHHAAQETFHDSIYNKNLLKISAFIRKCAMTEERQSEQPAVKDGELRNNTTNMHTTEIQFFLFFFVLLPHRELVTY